MPSATSTHARCSPPNRGSSITSTVRRWPCSGRRSTASASSLTRRRISRWRAPARWPPACRCWPSAQGSPSMRQGRPIVPPPHSPQPARAESWPASTRGYACGRPASRGIPHLPTSSSPTCRHQPHATGDSARGRTMLYGLLARDPLSDDAAAGVSLALGPLPPRAAAEHVAMARALNRRSSLRDARIHLEHALRKGDSSAATLLLYGELLVSSGLLREAVRAFAAAARDSTARPLATYRRARVLVRLGDSTAIPALSGFAERYPTDSAAPGALYIMGDMQDGRDDWEQAGRWYGELIKRYPADSRASLARFRLAAHAETTGDPDSAASLYQAEIDAAGP